VIDDETCIMCGRFVVAPIGMDPVTPPAPPRRWTRAGVVRAIRAYVFFHDRPPSEVEWVAPRGAAWPTARVVERLFGTFDAGLTAAGIDADRRDR
jgi:hypothetical protein